MVSPHLDTALAQRLESLTGQPAACCVEDLGAVVREVRADPAFGRALARAKAIGDENRLVALALLRRQGRLCACELQAALGVTHATVSHHMQQLEAAGLVTPQRRGRWVYYSLTDNANDWIP